jgi:hypothetical protein
VCRSDVVCSGVVDIGLANVNSASGRPRGKDKTRLAVYLGANNSRRFPPQHAGEHSAEGIRVRLLIAAIALLALCLWGLWHEFF